MMLWSAHGRCLVPVWYRLEPLWASDWPLVDCLRFVASLWLPLAPKGEAWGGLASAGTVDSGTCSMAEMAQQQSSRSSHLQSEASSRAKRLVDELLSI